MTLEKGLAAFLDAMLGKNRSSATLRAYRTDILQFITFLHENNVAITGVGDVGKVDVLEYLAAFARKGLTGGCQSQEGLSDPGILPLSGRGWLDSEIANDRHRHPKAGETHEAVSAL
jgi:hypothetical protein